MMKLNGPASGPRITNYTGNFPRSRQSCHNTNGQLTLYLDVFFQPIFQKILTPLVISTKLCQNSVSQKIEGK